MHVDSDTSLSLVARYNHDTPPEFGGLYFGEGWIDYAENSMADLDDVGDATPPAPPAPAPSSVPLLALAAGALALLFLLKD